MIRDQETDTLQRQTNSSLVAFLRVVFEEILDCGEFFRARRMRSIEPLPSIKEPSWSGP